MNRISFRQFGKMGRAGNQMLQYAFLKTYAKRFDLRLELPQWIGCTLFGTRDEAIREPLLPVQIERKDYLDQSPEPGPSEFINKDFSGWGQFHTGWYGADKEYVRSLFKPTQEIRDRMDHIVERFSGREVVGIHIRRGDYGSTGYFWMTPIDWYAEAMQKLRHRNPIFFISTEDRSVLTELAHFNPITAETLGVERQKTPMAHYQYLPHDHRTKDPLQIDFFPDWYLLSKCNIILGANSTFSFTAAMLGKCEAYFRSELSAKGFRRIDPWNSVPLNRERAEDFPEIRGTLTRNNPFWR